MTYTDARRAAIVSLGFPPDTIFPDPCEIIQRTARILRAERERELGRPLTWAEIFPHGVNHYETSQENA